jgi:hypothetical protein
MPTRTKATEIRTATSMRLAAPSDSGPPRAPGLFTGALRECPVPNYLRALTATKFGVKLASVAAVGLWVVGPCT